jgi:hypothetical protein
MRTHRLILLFTVILSKFMMISFIDDGDDVNAKIFSIEIKFRLRGSKSFPS